MNSHHLFDYFCYWVFGGVHDFHSVPKGLLWTLFCISSFKCENVSWIWTYRLGWWLDKQANIPFKEAMPTCFPKQVTSIYSATNLLQIALNSFASVLASVRLLNLYQQDRWKSHLKVLRKCYIFNHKLENSYHFTQIENHENK